MKRSNCAKATHDAPSTKLKTVVNFPQGSYACLVIIWDIAIGLGGMGEQLVTANGLSEGLDERVTLVLDGDEEGLAGGSLRTSIRADRIVWCTSLSTSIRTDRIVQCECSFRLAEYTEEDI